MAAGTVGMWNLDSIYKDFDSEEYREDYQRLVSSAESVSRYAKDMSEISGSVSPDVVCGYLERLEDFQVLYSGLYTYAGLRSSVNLSDTEAAGWERRLEQLFISLTEAGIYFGEYIRGIKDLNYFCRGNQMLCAYRYYLEKALEKQSRYLSPDTEKLIAGMSVTGSGAWRRLQTKIAAEAVMTVEENGRKITVPVLNVGSLPQTEDKQVKERRFRAELKAYEEYAPWSAMALNNLKGEVITLSGVRGFSSPLSQALSEYHIDHEILTALLESVEDYLPKLRIYYCNKAKRMGYESGLPYYEREAPVPGFERIYSFEEGKKIILEAFKGFSPAMYEYGKQAFDREWIDYGPAKGKAGGACCDGIYAVRESRIRMRYQGTLADINTLAHELGHGYHNTCLFRERALNFSYDLPIAETASKFSELLFKEELRRRQTDADKEFIDDFVVSGLINTVMDIQSRFYFEESFFKEREKREQTAEEISDLMLEAQRRVYADSLDENLLNRYMWLNKPHYYFPQRNYYNFPYSFGALLSIGMYRQYCEDKEKFVNNNDIC